jgi:hypothetical protein
MLRCNKNAPCWLANLRRRGGACDGSRIIVVRGWEEKLLGAQVPKQSGVDVSAQIQ